MPWLDYKDKYGSCEVASAPFECKICGRVIKYTRDSITCHLKKVHAINWPIYLERLRKMREGEKPGELPNIDFFECKICSNSVKFISRAKHLKGVHKITESEYVELFADELGKNQAKKEMVKYTKEEDYANEYDEPSQMPQGMMNGRPTNSPIPQFQNPMNKFSPNKDYQPQARPDPYENSYDAREQKYDITHPSRNNMEGNYFSHSVQAPSENVNPVNNNQSFLPKPPKSDIQNNANKACSSCQVKFETRRIFIEHCTEVHNMKFRTASGTKISASTLNQRPLNENMDVKRNFETDNQVPEPPRGNFSTQNFNENQVPEPPRSSYLSQNFNAERSDQVYQGGDNNSFEQDLQKGDTLPDTDDDEY